MRKRISLRLCVLLAMVFALCIVMSACESDGTNTPSDTTEPTLSGDTPHSDTNETSKRAFYSENGAMAEHDEPYCDDKFNLTVRGSENGLYCIQFYYTDSNTWEQVGSASITMIIRDGKIAFVSDAKLEGLGE